MNLLATTVLAFQKRNTLTVKLIVTTTAMNQVSQIACHTYSTPRPGVFAMDPAIVSTNPMKIQNFAKTYQRNLTHSTALRKLLIK